MTHFERLLWRAIGLLYEVDHLVHRVTEVLIDLADDERARRSRRGPA